MKVQNQLKLINDPIYGFITIPSPLLFQLIEHPYFQRLRRISQMGMSYLVYPGAHHTRFHHALGAMFLMQKAAQTLKVKGIEISADEEEALNIAILLHDIGHGPFSHALENSIVNVNHETISLFIMEELNVLFNNKLSLAITIFKNEYHRRFLHQLISGQLDMDRLDYLRRDSFYSGVSEGSINSQRLIAMLNVKNDTLVVEEKGIYSVEKFIIARRLMYWQVYLHKTGIVAEQLLLRLLKRAKQLSEEGINLESSKSLSYFLRNKIADNNFTTEALNTFLNLDDYDVMAAIKAWSDHEDFVLSAISKMLLNRNLLKVKLRKNSFSAIKVSEKLNEVRKKYKLTANEASFFVFTGSISNRAYSMDKDAIYIMKQNGKLVDVAKASDQFNLKALSQAVVKHYFCFPKNEAER